MTPQGKDAQAEALLLASHQAIEESRQAVAAARALSVTYQHDAETFRQALEEAKAALKGLGQKEDPDPAATPPAAEPT